MRDRRGAVVALAVLCGGVLAVTAVVAVTDDRDLAFRVGAPEAPALALEPGARACQEPIDAVEAFRQVRFFPAPNATPPELEVTVLDSSGRTIAAESLDSRSEAAVTATLDREVAGGDRPVAVCLAAGSGPATFLGVAGESTPGVLSVDGARAPMDLALDFLRAEPRSVLSLLPDVLRNAAGFGPRGVGAWTFWLLVAGVAVAVPFSLARALSRAS